ncbi:hypothetical protein OH76DRAFT_1409786 [Lentinus brumalis]|uniref:Uncharacterized protein n=1 Tax=Lentinus brumalis TaxID=2498619 RepID=A0A371CUA7_9APHY|nr:hypothetical protein OH76DRAFT_1409786 [Polyporus brumalis]
MPKIRYGRGFPDNRPPEFSSVTERFYDSSDGTTAESQLFPDVPMNSQHRFCTPPPLDPRLVDSSPSEADDFPQFTSRPPSPDDFDELTGARPPLPPLPGSKRNPIVVDEDDFEHGGLHRGNTTTASAPKRPTTSCLRPIPSTSQGRQPDAPATKATRSSPRKSKLNAAQPTNGSEVLSKVATHGHSPKKASPLSQVAYRAPSERPASPTLFQ